MVNKYPIYHRDVTLLKASCLRALGMSEKALKRFRQLPNQQQSHRNLFDYLKTMFERNEGMGGDIQGLHGLKTFIRGIVVSTSVSTPVEVLVGRNYQDDEEDLETVGHVNVV